MKILLVGNYLEDRQESMQRFASMLERGFQSRGHSVRVIRPQARAGKFGVRSHSQSKWLGYVDKFMIFPRELNAAVSWADVVHICDHSNAMYTACLQKKPHVVTCHDLLAVRGGLGEETDCPASCTGRILQRWILRGLKRASAVACVSSYTKSDFERLAGPSRRVHVVLNGLNYHYHRIPRKEAEDRLKHIEGVRGTQYILHVGSSLRRKNREGVIRIFHRIKNLWRGRVVFAGAPLSAEQYQMIKQYDMESRVTYVQKPDAGTLEALYNNAHAFLFPSRFEGFGWPLIEAQAAGCPVVCSDRCSIPEVVEGSALMRNVDDEEGLASDLLKLTEPEVRAALIDAGLKNIHRFRPEDMLTKYEQLYESVLAGSCK